jgi:hypothetical protein
VQMGCDRAGFYSFDRLDNGGRPSADHINPEWQRLQPGDRIASAPDASRWFDVALVAPQRALVLRASLTVPAARNINPADKLPLAYSDSTWGSASAGASSGSPKEAPTSGRNSRGAERMLRVARTGTAREFSRAGWPEPWPSDAGSRSSMRWSIGSSA